MTASTTTQEPTRRDFLYIATTAVGAVGAGFAVWPLIAQMNPDATTLAAASIEVDIGGIAVGQVITVKWRGKPVFVMHRTVEEIASARSVALTALPDPEADEARVQKPEWLVVIGICTHLGCVPLVHQGAFKGAFCPCHGSAYDTSGRIRVGPAPANLAVPPYKFAGDTKLVIG